MVRTSVLIYFLVGSSCFGFLTHFSRRAADDHALGKVLPIDEFQQLSCGVIHEPGLGQFAPHTLRTPSGISDHSNRSQRPEIGRRHCSTSLYAALSMLSVAGDNIKGTPIIATMTAAISHCTILSCYGDRLGKVAN